MACSSLTATTLPGKRPGREVCVRGTAMASSMLVLGLAGGSTLAASCPNTGGRPSSSPAPSSEPPPIFRKSRRSSLDSKFDRSIPFFLHQPPPLSQYGPNDYSHPAILRKILIRRPAAREFSLQPLFRVADRVVQENDLRVGQLEQLLDPGLVHARPCGTVFRPVAAQKSEMFCETMPASRAPHSNFRSGSPRVKRSPSETRTICTGGLADGGGGGGGGGKRRGRQKAAPEARAEAVACGREQPAAAGRRRGRLPAGAAGPS